MGIKYKNNAEGTLTAGISNSVTIDMTLTAGDGLKFPVVVLASGDYFYATLVDVSGNREIVKVTEHQNGTDVFQTFVRGQDDTTGIAFSIGDKVQVRIPKIVVEELQSNIDTNTSAISSNTALRHTQDTDVGTTSPTFQIGSGGPKVKNDSGVIQARNAADSAYANLKALGLTLTAALVIAGTLTGVTDITASGNITCVDLTPSGKTLARDHAGSTTPEVGNIIFGTGAPPAANSVPIGTLYIKYVA